MAYQKELQPCMDRNPRRFARTLSADDQAVGKDCVACDIAFVEGDMIESVLVGPGTNDLERAKQGKGTYMAVCLAAHATCVFGV